MAFWYVYVLFGLVIPGAIVGLLLFLAIVLRGYFLKKKYPMTVSVAPLLCWLVVILISLTCLSSGFRYPLCAVFQNRSARYITTGYVEDVSTVYALPIYYDSISHKWSMGKLLMIDGQQYYIPFGDVKVGAAISFVWGGDERVIYEYSLRTTVCEDEGETLLISESVVNHSGFDSRRAGQLIFSIFFVISAIIALLLFFTKNSVLNYLVNKDKEITQKIIPSQIGLLECVIFFTLSVGLAIGLALVGLIEALLICTVVVCLRVGLVVKTMHTELIIDNETIVIKEGKRKIEMVRNDIADVRLNPARMPYSRCLTIMFSNGQEIVFDQLYFWGISSVYSILNNNRTG